MARKKNVKASEPMTSTDELRLVLQTAINVSDLTKHLVRVNALVKEGIATGEVSISNIELSRRLQNEMNRITNLTIQVQNGVVSVRKPGIFTHLWSLVSGSFRKIEGKAEVVQAQRLMREQQRSLEAT
jgi:hypothetical protein